MTTPLMPKATAVWLVDNTTLTFNQISAFCGLHPLEVQGIADGDVAHGLIGEDPVTSGILTKAMIEAAEKDESVSLKATDDYTAFMHIQKKQKTKYTPVARRQDKPDAIAWLQKHHPELTDAQIVKLIGTTKKTVGAIKDRSFWNMTNIRPRDPVLLGLCTQTDLHAAIEKAEKAKAKEEASKKPAKTAAKKPAAEAEEAPAEDSAIEDDLKQETA